MDVAVAKEGGLRSGPASVMVTQGRLHSFEFFSARRAYGEVVVAASW